MSAISSHISLNGHHLSQNAMVIWLTGLSGAGKSSVAYALQEYLMKNSFFSLVLDGNTIRERLNKDLGFSLKDRYENIRRVAEICKILISNRIIPICAFISPTNEIRECARNIIGRDFFFEIYVKAPLEICEQRDPRGFYKKTRMGEITDFTGITSPFEVPENPALIIETNETPVEKNVELIYKAILPLIRIS